MNIKFTSTLTPEDENRIAPALIKTISGILDLLPIAYAIRIDTSDAKVYHHVGGSNDALPEGRPSRSRAPSAVGAAAPR